MAVAPMEYSQRRGKLAPDRLGIRARKRGGVGAVRVRIVVDSRVSVESDALIAAMAADQVGGDAVQPGARV